MRQVTRQVTRQVKLEKDSTMSQEPKLNSSGREVYGLRDTPFQRRMVRRSAENQATLSMGSIR